jgi:hypothetical protein
MVLSWRQAQAGAMRKAAEVANDYFEHTPAAGLEGGTRTDDEETFSADDGLRSLRPLHVSAWYSSPQDMVSTGTMPKCSFAGVLNSTTRTVDDAVRRAAVGSERSEHPTEHWQPW